MSQRRTPSQQAQALLAHSPIVLDLETTGLGSNDEIIEIVAIDSMGSVLLQRLVRPQQPIPPRVTAIHGIADGDVASEPTFLELWPEIEATLRGRLVATYNASFDRRLLHQTIARYKLVPVPCDWTCLLTLYRQVARPHERCSLGAACQRFGISHEQRHRALGDARAALALLYTLAATEDEARGHTPPTPANRPVIRADLAGQSARRPWRRPS